MEHLGISLPSAGQAAPLEDAAKWIGDYRRFWEENFDRLDACVGELQRKEKAGVRRRRPRKQAGRPHRRLHLHLRRAGRHRLPGVEQARANDEVVRSRGLALTMCEMDLSVDGAFRFAMAGPQRRADGKTTLTMNTLFDSQSM
ncbi:MAG: hypothetical protein HQ465_01375 [Rhodospirillales bacterium]|nr:hypothetical protein [Rhodospirillales bacterium]